MSVNQKSSQQQNSCDFYTPPDGVTGYQNIAIGYQAMATQREVEKSKAPAMRLQDERCGYCGTKNPGNAKRPDECKACGAR